LFVAQLFGLWVSLIFKVLQRTGSYYTKSSPRFCAIKSFENSGAV